MMRKIAVVFTIITFLGLLPIVLDKMGFFIVNKPVPAKNLIIEGWLNSIALDNAPFNYNDYDTIFVVGVKRSDKWKKLETFRNWETEKRPKDKFRLVSHGYLFLKSYDVKDFKDTITEIRVIAQGSQAKGQFAHFLLSVKDSMIAQTYVNEAIDTFTFKVKISPDQLKLFNLFFDNDMLTDSEDINLNIYEIIIDDISFYASENNFSHVKGLLSSHASFVAKKILSKENFKPEVIVIDTLYNRRNKTKAAADAFAVYLRNNKIHISSVNIYTQHNHSKRTLLNYQKALGPEVLVGSTVTDKNLYRTFHNTARVKNYLAIWDEMISLLGTVVLN